MARITIRVLALLAVLAAGRAAALQVHPERDELLPLLIRDPADFEIEVDALM